MSEYDEHAEQVYDWYGGQPNVAKIEPKEDLRKIPAAFGMDRELSTGCKAHDNYKQCLYYKKPDYERDTGKCRYLKFGFMCDKLVVNGEELN